MSNFRRRLMMSFEKKYTPVKYLKSTGTQYIDTGIFSTNAKIYISFKFNEIKNKSQVLINCTPATGGWFGLNSSGLITLGDRYFNIAYNDKHIFELEYKDGIIKATDENNDVQQYNISPSTRFTLFDDLNRRFPAYATLYYTKIYDNDTLVRDFVPVIDSSGIPCLYDKVEDKFYYNEGTGEFLYG